jgi:hypothetical protein
MSVARVISVGSTQYWGAERGAATSADTRPCQEWNSNARSKGRIRADILYWRQDLARSETAFFRFYLRLVLDLGLVGRHRRLVPAGAGSQWRIGQNGGSRATPRPPPHVGGDTQSDRQGFDDARERAAMSGRAYYSRCSKTTWRWFAQRGLDCRFGVFTSGFLRVYHCSALRGRVMISACNGRAPPRSGLTHVKAARAHDTMRLITMMSTGRSPPTLRSRRGELDPSKH